MVRLPHIISLILSAQPLIAQTGDTVSQSANRMADLRTVTAADSVAAVRFLIRPNRPGVIYTTRRVSAATDSASRDRHIVHTLIGAAVGVIAGGIVGDRIGYNADHTCGLPACDGPNLAELYDMYTFAALGLLLGAVVGWLWH